MAAYGTAAAIAQTLGGKKVKALEKFAKAVQRPRDRDPARPNESPDMGVLRSRIKAAMAAGEI